MDQRRKGENKMQREIQQQSRRRPENQMAAQNHHPPAPPQKCPRCDSVNTKFCYYNNYSLSQPRYFCKACRRYWTHGGTLRNVPVGGGCRKSKRPKPSTATSSSSTTEIARAHQAATPPPNLTGMVSGQALRAPILPTMCNNNNNAFYTGGAFLSSLASMQSLPTGINQGPAQNFVAGGNSNGQYDVNMALLQNLQYLRPNQGQIELSASQQSLNLNPVRPVLNSWTQSFIRGSAGAPAAGPSSSFWSRTAVEGENQAGSISFHSNQWTDNNNINNNNNPGFDPTR